MKGIKLKNFSNYWIFPELGMIWSIKSNRWIGAKDKNNGYWYVTLTADSGRSHTYRLHRLIWMSVYGEIPKGYEINHTTENLDMNMISCLSLVTPKQNANFGTRNKRRGEKLTNGKLSKQVARCDLNGNVLETFPSTMESGRCGYSQSNVVACCNGKKQSYKGFLWKYAT